LGWGFFVIAAQEHRTHSSPAFLLLIVLQEGSGSEGTGNEASDLDQGQPGTSSSDSGSDSDPGATASSEEPSDHEDDHAGRHQNGKATSGKQGKSIPQEQQQQEQEQEDVEAVGNGLVAAEQDGAAGHEDRVGLALGSTPQPSSSTTGAEVTSWARHVNHTLTDAEVAALKAGGAKFTSLDLTQAGAVAAPPAAAAGAAAAAGTSEAYRAGWKRVKWHVAGRASLPPTQPQLAAMRVKERVRTRWMELQEQVKGVRLRVSGLRRMCPCGGWSCRSR
jgi:hypothetical protein